MFIELYYRKSVWRIEMCGIFPRNRFERFHRTRLELQNVFCRDTRRLSFCFRDQKKKKSLIITNFNLFHISNRKKKEKSNVVCVEMYKSNLIAFLKFKSFQRSLP